MGCKRIFASINLPDTIEISKTVIEHIAVGNMFDDDLIVGIQNNIITSVKSLGNPNNFSKQEVIELLLKREQHIQDNFAPQKTILSIDAWINQNLK